MFQLTSIKCGGWIRRLACLAAVVPVIANAQELRGTVLREDGRAPASGVVVVLADSGGNQIIARTVTGSRGVFVLKSPWAGALTLRVLRVGYEAMTVGTFRLAADESREVRVQLDERRVNLATIQVKGGNSCEARSGGAEILTLFSQAQTALLSSMSTLSGVRGEADIVNFVRNEMRNGSLDGEVQRSVITGESARPYASVPAAELARTGYAQEAEDGTVLFAPDADVLLSESFVYSHCFSLVDAEDKDSNVVGIAFHPAAPDGKKVDVRGTLWLNRKTADLLYLEYSYEPLHIEYRRLKIGGRVGYRKTQSGAWFVSEWSIRTPREFRSRLRAPNDPTRGNQGLLGVQTVGGEVLALRFDDELQYHNDDAWRAGSLSSDVLNLRITQSNAASASRRDTLVIDVPVADNNARVAPATVPAVPITEVMPTGARKSAVYVRTALGQAIAYATVQVNGGSVQVTDTTGRLVINSDADTLRLLVRRLGYVAFEGKVARKSKAEPFRVMLNQNAQGLANISVVGNRTKSPLELSGFYQRMQDVQRGAIVGEFFTPEILEARGTGNLSDMLRTSRYLQFDRVQGRGDVLMGNSCTGFNCTGKGCKMNIFLDGIRVTPGLSSDPVYLNEVANGTEVAAVEIYRSAANAPSALHAVGSDGTCGIVAIWTGSRR